MSDWESTTTGAGEAPLTAGGALPQWLAFLSWVVLLYPLFPLFGLYGEWALAWFHLGHQPIPSANDPKFIDGSNWLHPVVAVALVGLLPAGCAAPVFISTCFTVVDADWKIRTLKIVGFSFLWIGSAGLLILDPWGVMYWWLD